MICQLNECGVEFFGRGAKRYCCEEHRIKANAKAYRVLNLEKIREYQKAYRSEFPEKSRESHNRSAYGNPTAYVKTLRKIVKARCKRNGQEFNPAAVTSLSDAPPTHCLFCGDEIDYSQGRRKQSPSIDRLDNTKGYIIGNVAVICLSCNVLKSDGTALHHEQIAAGMRRLGLN